MFGVVKAITEARQNPDRAGLCAPHGKLRTPVEITTLSQARKTALKETSLSPAYLPMEFPH
jgi:hypothetical protein